MSHDDDHAGRPLNRAARRRLQREARRTERSAGSQRQNGAGEPESITMNHGPDGRNASCRKITERIVNPLANTVTLKSVAYEDLIHPIPLAFDPPYLDLASSDEANGFRHIWEKLTYAFALADPAQFPTITGLAAADRDALEKYIAACRKLAGYGAIAHNSSFNMQSTNGNWTVTTDFPDDEQLVAVSARFRQLNNQGEPTAFSTASDLIIKAVKEQQPDLVPVVASWRKARAALLNRTIATIVCDMTLPAGPRPADFPVSYGNLRPEDLFNTYFYGDFLHVADNAGQLVDINSEDGNAAYHMFGFLISMSALAHLYFGFSILVEHALGVE